MPETTTSIASTLKLTGPQKAAILLLSFDESVAVEVLKNLSEMEIHQITNQMQNVENISNQEVVNIRKEFNQKYKEQELIKGKGINYLKELLKQFMADDKIEYFLNNLAEPIEQATLDSLNWLDDEALMSFLKNEHPQTIALIMSYLKPEKAATVLLNIPAKIQHEVMMRLAYLDRISLNVINDLNNVIREELMTSGGSKSNVVGGIERAAEIINHLDHSIEVEILSRIEEKNPNLAEEIKNLMFTFEDLKLIDDRSMQSIMKEVNNADLVLALKTASEEIKEKIFKNVSERAVDMLKEDMEAMGPVKLRDVEAAQRAIVNTAKRLEEEGKVVMVGKGEDVYV
jgi:flagellar motor switch protein FliG